MNTQNAKAAKPMRVEVQDDTTLEDMMALPVMGGASGDDFIKGTSGNDNIWAGSGNDTVKALAGDDYVSGGLGNDKLYGEAGNDYLEGRGGNDKLVGGKGDDTLVGSRGSDSLIGNAGNDVFVISSSKQMDKIYTFQDGQDLIGGLRYQDVTITGYSNTTVIKHNGRKVAKLPNVSPDSITADDFQLIEPNDTIRDAVDTHLTEGETFNISSEIGDSPDHNTNNDADLFKVEVAAGATITADVDTPSSPLDPVLSVFNSSGTQVAQNDDYHGLDSFIEFTATASDTYYVGVSSFNNINYNPITGNQYYNGNSHGEYDLSVSVDPPPASI